MAFYYWEGINLRGQLVKGEVEAKSVEHVLEILKNAQIEPKLDNIYPLKSKIKPLKKKQLIFFTRQLAILIEAGIPVVQALIILANSSKANRLTYLGLKNEIELGKPLSEALVKYPLIFDELYIFMIKAGEESGNLEVVLKRLAKQLEKKSKIKSDILTALIYPIVVIIVAIIVTAILMIFVVPVLAELFQEANTSLPLLTQIVITISNQMVAYLGVISFILISVVFFISFLLRQEKGRIFFDQFLLRLPVIKHLIKKSNLIQLFKNLSLLLNSGIIMLDALKICATISFNRTFSSHLLTIRQSVAEGKMLADSFATTIFFPDIVIEMLRIGETVGGLETMLDKLANYYEIEFEQLIASFKQLFEPVLIFVLGAIIGTLVIAMYLPIFQLGAL